MTTEVETSQAGESRYSKIKVIVTTVLGESQSGLPGDLILLYVSVRWNGFFNLTIVSKDYSYENNTQQLQPQKKIRAVCWLRHWFIHSDSFKRMFKQ